MPITSVRRTTLPAIDAVKERLFGGFAMSHSTEDEYAATLYCPEGELEELLEDQGFTPSLFSALKVRYDRNTEDGSWVWRESLTADMQLHVVSHAREDSNAIDLYAHWERSNWTHPIKHYRKVDYDAETGVELLRRMLSAYHRDHPNPPKYEVQPPHHRSWAWALHLVSFISTPTAVRLGQVLEDPWSTNPVVSWVTDRS